MEILENDLSKEVSTFYKGKPHQKEQIRLTEYSKLPQIVNFNNYQDMIGLQCLAKYPNNEIKFVEIRRIIKVDNKVYIQPNYCDRQVIPIKDIRFPTYILERHEDSSSKKIDSDDVWGIIVGTILTLACIAGVIELVRIILSIF